MPIYENPADAPDTSSYGGSLSAADYDREILFAQINGASINVFQLTDWLETMQSADFWTFPRKPDNAGQLRDVIPVLRLTVGQHIFNNQVWREFTSDWRNNPNPAATLLEHLYEFRGGLVDMYANRHTATRTGYSHNSREKAVQFDSVMDRMVRFVVAQLPFLHVLHELDQECYETTTADEVRGVVRAVLDGRYSYHSPFNPWLATWVQYHVRAVIRRAAMAAAKQHNSGGADDDDSGGPEVATALLRAQRSQDNSPGMEP